jgi:hypothetical protein
MSVIRTPALLYAHAKCSAIEQGLQPSFELIIQTRLVHCWTDWSCCL